jgi:hypothetical protein
MRQAVDGAARRLTCKGHVEASRLDGGGLYIVPTLEACYACVHSLDEAGRTGCG